MSNYKLSIEEQEILNQFEDGRLINSPNHLQLKKEAEQAACDFLKKDKRINIRMRNQDLNYIKYIATQEGIPYQTLISSVLHKYVLGYLKHEKI